MVGAFVRMRAMALYMLLALVTPLALVTLSAPLHAAPFHASAASFAPCATHMSDATKNDAVIGLSHQIEAIRRMPVSVPSRALMRSDTTHMGLVAKNDKNTAISAVKLMMPVYFAGGSEKVRTPIAVRAPPRVFL